MGGAMPTLMLTSIIRARYDADVPWAGAILERAFA